MKKRTYARLPKTAYKPDLKEVIGKYKEFPRIIDSFTSTNGFKLVLRALQPDDYRVFRNNVSIVQYNNEYTATEAFKNLKKRLCK